MWFTTALIVAAIAHSCDTSQDVYHVKPDDSSPLACLHHQCITWSQFQNMTNSTFDGSTFVFLAGNHTLKEAILFQNVSNVTLKGPGTLIFEQNASVHFYNVANFFIEGIQFALCSKQVESALEIVTSYGITILQCDFIGTSNRAASTVRAILTIMSSLMILDCFFEGNTGQVGGAIAAWRGSNLTVSGSRFNGNSAMTSGGAISVFESMAVLDGTPANIFTKNVANLENGGAIECDTCVLIMKGNNTFSHNGFLTAIDTVRGGGIGGVNGTLLFVSGITTFLENEASGGGGIATSFNSSLICHGETVVVFKENKALSSGGGLMLYESFFQTGKCKLLFMGNHAKTGGAGIIFQRFEDTIVEPSILSGNFINNKGDTGSAFFIQFVKNVVFNHSVFDNNSLYILNSNVTFEDNKFQNSSQDFGGAIYSGGSSLKFTGHHWFDGNQAKSGGALHLLRVQAAFYGHTLFTHNSAKENGGGIYTFQTAIKLYDTVNFTSNFARNGGGVYFDGDSLLSLKLSSRFYSILNKATDYGGVLYYVDNADSLQCKDQQNEPGAFRCCIKIDEDVIKESVWNRTKVLLSYNDSAGNDGNFLYGGLLDRCYVLSKNDYGNETHIATTLKFLTDRGVLTVRGNSNKKHTIASRPYILKYCDSNQNYRNETMYRGQKFMLPLVAIAQGNTPTRTSVTAITSSNSTLALLQNPQYLPQYCTNLTYNLFSTMESEELVLYPEGPCHDIGLARIVISVTLLPCPDGTIQQSDRCECEPGLHDYNISCTIDEDFQFTKKAGSMFWMGAEYRDGLYEGLVLYKTCPNGYCSTNEVNMSSLHDLDVQCAPGRVGLLCGSCAENNSLLFGGSKCGQCSNNYLILILAFAAAGIILVAFLSILKLTVATGMLNCLILFANIVQVNRKLFLSTNTAKVLTVFIAWLNLDLGFETCFYDGMDAFVQTCLQFAFPAYVWFLISLIIVTSRYSIIMSKMIGHNPIAVLATLLLMSYTKILNIIIEVFSSIKLKYPHGKTSTVWLKDASVPYLQSKHLALAVVTVLVSVFFFLPYTFLLLFGHKLYRFSRVRHLRWINKLKPLLDSYYAPYNIQTRFWTGFLLLVRCALYTVFSFNSLGNTNWSLLAIIVTFTSLLFAQGILLPGRIYTKFCLNFLEAFSYMNLVVLSAVTLVQVSRKAAIIHFLIGVMLTITIGVLAYHIHLLCTVKGKLYSKLQNRISDAVRRRPNSTFEEETDPLIPQEPHQFVSKSDVRLRESLLEDY